MAFPTCWVTDDQGRRLAGIEIQGVEEDWRYGRLVKDGIPEGLRRDLEWYDEVVSGQMLSYLDDALAAVARHHLSVRFPDETSHPVYSLHVSKAGEVAFRITPVPPPDPSRVEVSSLLDSAPTRPTRGTGLPH